MNKRTYNTITVAIDECEYSYDCNATNLRDAIDQNEAQLLRDIDNDDLDAQLVLNDIREMLARHLPDADYVRERDELCELRVFFDDDDIDD